nr:GuaB1 family IMP dehydrogenase-related protein [Prescottella equi]
MTAVAGRRMAETVARRGGLVVIPQDVPSSRVAETVEFVKSRHLVRGHPDHPRPRGRRLRRTDPAAQASGAHRARSSSTAASRSVCSPSRPARTSTGFTRVGAVAVRDFATAPVTATPREVFRAARVAARSTRGDRRRRRHAGRVLTLPVRSGPHLLPRRRRAGPAADRGAVGVNGDVAAKAKALAEPAPTCWCS